LRGALMQLNVDLVKLEKRIVLERLLQLMLYEGGMEPGADGLIDWGESLDSYFGESMNVPLFFMMEGRIVGFTLIKLGRMLKGPDGHSNIKMNVIEEFFIVRPWRRKGIGTAAAHMILNRYRGQWAITTFPDDARTRFWRHVATGYKQGKSHEFSPGEHMGFPGQFVWMIDT